MDTLYDVSTTLRLKPTEIIVVSHDSNNILAAFDHGCFSAFLSTKDDDEAKAAKKELNRKPKSILGALGSLFGNNSSTQSRSATSIKRDGKANIGLI